MACIRAVLAEEPLAAGGDRRRRVRVARAAQQPGLGAHLFAALEEKVPVIGVAKNPFHASHAIEIVRGDSKKPLYVSAAGMTNEEASGCVRRMHGVHRLPTLLKEVDRLCREGG